MLGAARKHSHSARWSQPDHGSVKLQIDERINLPRTVGGSSQLWINCNNYSVKRLKLFVILSRMSYLIYLSYVDTLKQNKILCQHNMEFYISGLSFTLATGTGQAF